MAINSCDLLFFFSEIDQHELDEAGMNLAVLDAMTVVHSLLLFFYQNVNINGKQATKANLLEVLVIRSRTRMT